MLPNEDEVRAYVAENHRRLLAHCGAAIALAVARLERGEVVGSGLAPLTIQTLLGLLVRATKTTRSAMILYENGLSTDASVLLRSLFEIRVAIRFIGLKSLALQIGRKPAPVVDGTRPFTQDFRAMLYVAHQGLEYERQSDEFAGALDPEVSGLAKPPSAEDSQYLDALKSEIGPLWTKILTSRKSFSGLQHADLVESVGLDNQKRVVFRRLSWAVHGIDALRHAEYKDDSFALSLTPEGSNIDAGLSLLTASLVDCMKTAMDAGLDLWSDDELQTHLSPPAEALPLPDDGRA